MGRAKASATTWIACLRSGSIHVRDYGFGKTTGAREASLSVRDGYSIHQASDDESTLKIVGGTLTRELTPLASRAYRVEEK